MTGKTEYLITIGGMFQAKSSREFSTAMVSSVVDIPNEWTEFEIQKYAIEMLFRGQRDEVDMKEAAIETFVMNLYRAVPNQRKTEAPKKSGSSNEWMKDFIFGTEADSLFVSCKKCGDIFYIGELYNANKLAFEHRKVCVEK